MQTSAAVKMSADIVALLVLARTELREPETLTVDASGNVTATFDPPLTSAEQVIAADLLDMARLGLTALTLAEYRARKADIADIRVQLIALAQWLALPTGAAKTNNAIAAEQAIGTALTELARVVGALLKVELN